MLNMLFAVSGGMLDSRIKLLPPAIKRKGLVVFRAKVLRRAVAG